MSELDLVLIDCNKFSLSDLSRARDLKTILIDGKGIRTQPLKNQSDNVALKLLPFPPSLSLSLTHAHTHTRTHTYTL